METQRIFVCHFIFLTANIAIPLLNTISPVLEIYPLVMKVSKGAKIRNRYNQVPHLSPKETILDDAIRYASFKIQALISCSPLLFSLCIV